MAILKTNDFEQLGDLEHHNSVYRDPQQGTSNFEKSHSYIHIHTYTLNPQPVLGLELQEAQVLGFSVNHLDLQSGLNPGVF